MKKKRQWIVLGSPEENYVQVNDKYCTTQLQVTVKCPYAQKGFVQVYIMPKDENHKELMCSRCCKYHDLELGQGTLV